MRGSLAVRDLLAAVLAALLAASAYALASPPWDLSLLAWITPPLLLLPASRLRGAWSALPGLVFGFAIAVGVTSWAWHASLAYFELDRAASLAFASVVWLLYGGLPCALLTAGYALTAPRVRAGARPLLAAWWWVAIEILRSLPPLGLPWGLLSHTQWRQTTLIQLADVFGAYGVTFLVVLVSVGVALALYDPDAPATDVDARSRSRRLAPGLAALALALAYGVASRASEDDAAHTKRVAVVQGDIPNAFRWQRTHAERVLGAYLRLSAGIVRGADVAPELIVWPENAVDFYLAEQPLLLGRLRTLARRSGAALLVGAPRLAGPGAARNSTYLIDAQGTLRDTYDKRLLVPFAESPLLPAIAHAADEPEYGAGAHAGPLASRDFALGVLICFEVLFPDLVRATVRDGANLLVNVSNDSWMDAGDGAAARQHFAMSVLRAVEMRRALVRASAGGTSGFVSARGEVHDVVPWGGSGTSVGAVALHDGLTPYARFGEAWMLLAAALLVSLRRPAPAADVVGA